MVDIECIPDAFFRTFDGVCNNLKNPWWGTTNIPFQRLMPAQYQDGKLISNSFILLILITFSDSHKVFSGREASQ